MARTGYYVGSSLDGFIADPDGGIDWLLQFNDLDGLAGHFERYVAGVGALAMGRATYRFILREGGAWAYGDRPAWVFTHRTDLPRIPGADLRFTARPVREVHAEMTEAAGGRGIWLVGGGALVAAFAGAGLLDEIHLCLAPVTRGAGAPLLPIAIDTPMRLESVERFGDGFAILRYALR